MTDANIGATIERMQKVTLEIQQKEADLLKESFEKKRKDRIDEKLMRLRDEFAMAALTGLIGRVWNNPNAKEVMNMWAKSAYLCADEMMKAREVKS